MVEPDHWRELHRLLEQNTLILRVNPVGRDLWSVNVEVEDGREFTGFGANLDLAVKHLLRDLHDSL